MAPERKEMVDQLSADPELMAIRADPLFQQLLVECSSNPGALAAHMKNAGVAAAKVQKLVDAGLIAS